jgi:hypothetical protein
MSNQVKVKAIQIEYPDGSTKQLTIDDARELHRQLETLFGVRIETTPGPVIIERDWWPRWRQVWSSDDVIDTGTPLPLQSPQVWCCAESSL